VRNGKTSLVLERYAIYVVSTSCEIDDETVYATMTLSCMGSRRSKRWEGVGKCCGDPKGRRNVPLYSAQRGIVDEHPFFFHSSLLLLLIDCIVCRTKGLIALTDPNFLRSALSRPDRSTSF
jgi:hypothetical protein